MENKQVVTFLVAIIYIYILVCTRYKICLQLPSTRKNIICSVMYQIEKLNYVISSLNCLVAISQLKIYIELASARPNIR